ncbi:hypothetical protein [Bacillus sp. 1P06AnD]|uniref:hypothetical protein n=1 Tax=Bacillus sp. 1P06AnD TaxID=3132208 RepID=UPI0039A19CE9
MELVFQYTNDDERQRLMELNAEYKLIEIRDIITGKYLVFEKSEVDNSPTLEQRVSAIEALQNANLLGGLKI